MPRNVVTLRPRLLALPTRRNRETRERIEQVVVERYRARILQNPERIEMDFPTRLGGRAAKNEVIKTLDATETRWRRLFVLYPTESALRDRPQ